MAETRGLVQRITILADSLTCVWIGPTPNNVEALMVINDGSPRGSAYAASLIQALTAASCSYREVICTHGDSDARITSVQIDPV